MGFAFEITVDDVVAAAEQLGVDLDDDVADSFFDDLDGDDIETAALSAECTDDDEETLCLQTVAAIVEIKRQLLGNEDFLFLLNSSKN